MSTYSLAEEIIAKPESVKLLSGLKSPRAGKVADFVERAVRIRMDEPASWYFLDEEKEDWRFGSKSYGPARNPFPLVWVEWDCPTRYFAEGVWGINPVQSGACAILEISIDEFLDHMDSSDLDESQKKFNRKQFLFVKHVLVIESFARMRDGRLIDEDRTYFGVNEAGEFKQNITMIDMRFYPRFDSRALINVLVESIRPAIIGLGLLNCKNVTLSDVVLSPATRRQRKRGSTPKLTFKTLRITGKSASKRSAKAEHAGGKVPFHLVRGHFKTFTEDAPLLGHATGTYWWASQARGKKANGIISKDYEVAK